LKKHFPFIIFFAFFLVVGLAIYRDYGVPWDEYAQMKIGEVNTRYVLNGNPNLLSFKNRYYGPVFEVLIWVLNRNKVFNRHLATFIAFAFGVMALYILAYRLFRGSRWSLLTVVLLVLSPRIFADSFYNSKDIPFLAFFTMAVLSSVYLLDTAWSGQRWSAKIGAAALSAFVCAVAVDIRVPGIVLIPLISILLVLVVICNPKRWKDVGVMLAVYLVLAMVFIILFWPILWHHPRYEFINGLETMGHYSWTGHVLYRGKWILANDLPWDYVPTWVLISTPLLQLGGFVLGVFSLTMVAVNNVRSNFSKSFRSYLDKLTPDSLAWLVIIGWLVLPLAAVIILHSVIYDGWRQMYFIYPSILLIAVFGMKTVWELLSSLFRHSTASKILAGTVLAVGLLEPLVFTLQYHPHENVYFNAFAGDPKTLRQNFEQDYWGLSYKQGIDYILAHDSSKKINLAIADLPGEEYIEYMLTHEQASRLVVAIGSLENADYFVTVFRGHPEDYTIGKEYYSVSVRGTKIMTVYKMK
jgi:hypothetical protein